ARQEPPPLPSGRRLLRPPFPSQAGYAAVRGRSPRIFLHLGVRIGPSKARAGPSTPSDGWPPVQLRCRRESTRRTESGPASEDPPEISWSRRKPAAAHSRPVEKYSPSAS